MNGEMEREGREGGREGEQPQLGTVGRLSWDSILNTGIYKLAATFSWKSIVGVRSRGLSA